MKIIGGAVLVLTASLACEDSSTPRTPEPNSTITDSAGVTIVDSHKPMWSQDEAWTVSARPTTSIGLADGPQELQLFRVSDAVRLADGRIGILNSSSAELRVFDVAGRFVTSIGGSGRGPGEFLRPEHVVRMAGDTLAVWDSGVTEVSYFDPAGAFVRRESLDLSHVMEVIGPTRATEMLTPLPDGSFILHVTVRESSRQIPTNQLYRPPLGYYRFHRDSARVDSLGWYGGLAQMVVETGGRRTPVITLLPIRSSVTGGGDPLHVFAGGGEHFDIDVFDGDGHHTRTIRRTDGLVPVTAEIRELSRASRLDPGERSDRRQEVERLLDALPAQDFFPAYYDLVTDSEGCLWAQAANGWQVFDPDGTWLGTVGLPIPRVFEIGFDYVLGLRWDDDGIEHVMLYALDRKPMPHPHPCSAA